MTRADPASSVRSINLALQGGGSHGAFTWGVLDSLLADGRIGIDGLSGTSAGAVNAVALASGWGRAVADGNDPRQGARDALARIWQEIAAWGRAGALPAQIASMLWGGLPAEYAPANVLKALTGFVSPYQTNPLDLNPLRDLLKREIDFEAVARGSLRVFASATHVRTGKAVIFGGANLTLEAVLASACLPMLFKAVEIDGEHYWDGGYAVNPAITPLIESCASADVMLVQINPLRRTDVPQSATGIADRISELTFNASLLTQMRSIDLINQLIAQGALRTTSLRTVHMHRIDGGTALEAYAASSRISTDPDMIHAMFEAGKESSRLWLDRHFDAIGIRSTIDIRRDYLDDTREVVPETRAEARPARGFRPWLQRLFRRSKSA